MFNTMIIEDPTTPGTPRYTVLWLLA